MSERRLQYNYAGIDLETGECLSCATYSYEINLPNFIPVPEARDEYCGKFYHDGQWYEDAEFTIPWSIDG